jgi:hypothetical protein
MDSFTKEQDNDVVARGEATKQFQKTGLLRLP